MSDFNYYKAGLDDIDVLIEYRIRFATELLGEQEEENIHKLKEQLKDYFEETIKNDKSISFIAKEDQEVAGIGTLVVREQLGGFKNLSGKWGYIMSMYTVPGFRRRGICRRILTELTAEALKQDIRAFELDATEEGAFVYVQEGFIKYDQPTYRKMITLNE
jgi:ribosomal protein S18 acetylase RimI-like enzyme